MLVKAGVAVGANLTPKRVLANDVFHVANVRVLTFVTKGASFVL